MDLAGKKVLVTGAGGFIGSHLVEALLEKGADVSCFVRYTSSGSWGLLDDLSSAQQGKLTIIKGDLTDSDALRTAMAGIDVVFHLAAMIAIPHSYNMPREAVQVNVLGTLNALIAARDAGVTRFVHTSTSEVYGTAQYVPIDEKHPLQGQSPYSASKIGADKIAESFHLSYGLPIVILRPFNTYGPRQSARAVIPTIIMQALTQDAVRLGSLDPTRDFLFVKDTAQGFIKAAETDAAIGKTVHIGTGKEISIGDLAEKIIGVVGRDVSLARDDNRVRPANSEVQRLCADPSQARDLLGWQPGHTLDEGLAQTVEWIKKNIDRYRTGEYVK